MMAAAQRRLLPRPFGRTRGRGWPSRLCAAKLQPVGSHTRLLVKTDISGSFPKYWGYIGIMEKKLDTPILGLCRNSTNIQARETPCAASSTWLGLLVPASLGMSLSPSLAPGSLAETQFRWIFENFVHVGSVSIGLPGLVSLGIFLNPMFEAMPRIRKAGDVGQMPMLPYSAMASQGMVWTAYGLLLNNPAVWTPNLCAAGLGMYYMFVYNSHWQDPGHLLLSHIFKVGSTMAFSALAYGLPQDVALNLLGLTGNMMTLFMFGGPLAAIRTVVRERSTRALNLGFTCIVNLNCTLWFFYAYFMLDDPYIYLQDGIGIILATIQLALFARYGVQRH